MIERKAKVTVNEWITHGNDAFLLTGARQIGKTYLIRQCLKESGYPYIEFNFIEQPELVNLFAGAKDAKELLMRLSVVAKEPLEQGKTIIFLDEIQEFKDIVTRIKFLVEDGTFRYIMSGSLLGVELNDLRSAPVGYLEIYDMYPLDFKEFVRAAGLKNDVILMLEDHFKKRNPVDDFIHSKMLDLFYLYLIVGGMPEAVAVYLETNDLAKVAKVHEKIIRLYKTDFSKYEKNYKLKLQEIYDAMPGQLDQKNKRFQLNAIEKGMSYDRLKNDFLWLKDAGVAIPVYNISEPKLPLIISENRNLFKLFFSDVGLLTSCYSNQVKLAILNKEKAINNGALFENVAAQELLAKRHKEYYFNSKQQGELDFVIELDGKVVPLEIKSGKDYKRHSALNNVLKNENYKIEDMLKMDIFDLKIVNEKGEKVFATRELESEEMQKLYKTEQEAKEKYENYSGSYSESCDKIDDNEIRFNLTATGNEKTFPESKKLIITFNKLRISKWIEDKNEETILSGNWNYEIDVPENMAKTNITNYKLKSISDENYKFEKAYCSNTAFKIYLNNCSGISWNEKDCVENSKGEKFYPAQRSDGDGEISTNVDGTVKFHNTYNLTNYDATDTLKVHLFKTTGEEVVIELEKEE